MSSQVSKRSTQKSVSSSQAASWGGKVLEKAVATLDGGSGATTRSFPISVSCTGIGAGGGTDGH